MSFFFFSFNALQHVFQGLQKHVTVESLRANITASDTVRGLKNTERKHILWVISVGLMVHLVTVWKKWLVVIQNDDKQEKAKVRVIYQWLQPSKNKRKRKKKTLKKINKCPLWWYSAKQEPIVCEGIASIVRPWGFSPWCVKVKCPSAHVKFAL